jgi:hypothetical protein
MLQDNREQITNDENKKIYGIVAHEDCDLAYIDET